ncbi:MAG: MFS transporter [Myxococcota bacterium]
MNDSRQGQVSSSGEVTLDLSTKLSFSVAAMASGTLSMGVAYFSMVYYNAALGVSATIVGAALALALVVDAISDPLVGTWSDRVRTRWGRRLPFMYAAALPSAILFWVFWNPPAWALASDVMAFWYLFLLTAAIRLTITLFDVPVMALVPELTDSYDGRSELLSYHSNMLFGWTALVSAAMYGYFLKSTPEYTTGVLNVTGYQEAGLAGALVVVVAMWACAAGLHKHIPRLQEHQDAATHTATHFRDLLKPFRNRSLAALLASRLISAAVYGTHAALFQYMARYFWDLPEHVLFVFSLVAVIGVPVAFWLMPRLFYGREKKHVAILILSVGLVCDSGPVILRLFELMPANGTDALIYTYYGIGIVQNAIGILSAVAIGSMLAEVVDDHAARTGDHLAGLISSSQTFMKKATSGLGTAIAGWVLAAISFPTKTDVSEVPAETIFDLGLFYGPLLAVLSLAAILVLLGYNISRADHDRNIETIAAREGQGP